MKRTLLTILLTALAFTTFSACRKDQPAQQQSDRTDASDSTGTQTATKVETQPDAQFDLKILYAGNPGSRREADFVEFLKKHFKEVKTGDLAVFNGSQADAVDVTILDYDGRAPEPFIPEDYTAPTITMGATGAQICGRLGLAPGYL